MCRPVVPWEGVALRYIAHESMTDLACLGPLCMSSFLVSRRWQFWLLWTAMNCGKLRFAGFADAKCTQACLLSLNLWDDWKPCGVPSLLERICSLESLSRGNRPSSPACMRSWQLVIVSHPLTEVTVITRHSFCDTVRSVFCIQDKSSAPDLAVSSASRKSLSCW